MTLAIQLEALPEADGRDPRETAQPAPITKTETKVLAALAEAATDVTAPIELQVSYIKVVTAKARPTFHCKPEAIIERIRTDKKLQTKVARIRLRFNTVFAKTEGDRKAKTEAAKKAVGKAKAALPAVLLSGTFDNANTPVAEKLIQHSGLLCADLDGLGETLHEVRVKLLSSPHLWAVFLSPTGDGLKGVFRVAADKAKHLASFRAVQKHVRDVTGVAIDKSCKDVGRLCFLSSDPDVYLIDGAIELEPLEEPEPEQNDSSANVDSRRKVAEEILGPINWENEKLGYCDCPGMKRHNAVDSRRDCRVTLDGVPTVFCLHNSCKGIVAGVNRELRWRLGKQTKAKPEPIIKRLVDLTPAVSDDPNTLLGNRFLCRGGGLLFVGFTGIGKSTAVIQLGVHWAIGRTCLGINPAGPLRVLYYNAENDEGDLAEMRDGAIESLGELDEQERRDFAENFICVFESCRTGQGLIDKIESHMTEHKPDLLILDPALSYIGGDANQQEVVGGFLRNMLNPLLQSNKCGGVIVHHPPKPRNEQGKKIASDYAYLGAGSAEWGNWARSMLMLSAKNDSGLRELRIGKRFRLGWKDANGISVVAKLLQQNAEGEPMFYRELKGNEALLASANVSPTQKVLHSELLPEPGESLEKKALVAAIVESKYAGRDKARDEIIPLLIHEGYLVEERVSQGRGAPAVHLRRTDKKENRISFAAN
jgi:hypothetical protein